MVDFQRAEHDVFVKRTLTVALTIIGLAGALWVLGQLSQVIFMVFVALFVAVAFEPPVHFLAKRGWRRGLAAGVVFLVSFILTILFVVALAPVVVEQVAFFIDAIPEMAESLATFVEDTFAVDLSDFEIQDGATQVVGALQAVGATLVGGVIGITASVVGFLIFATTVALFAFYMIAELPKLQRTVLSFMPETQQRRALRIWDVAVEKMGGYIYSRLILAALSAIVTWGFLTILDVPFAASLGIFVGVLSQFVPVVGTYIASILPALVALTFNGLSTAIWAVVFFLAYQQIENYFFSPIVTRRTMEIHPAVSVAAIFIGGTLMGAIGVLLALPMTGIVQAMISESRKSYDVILDDPEDDELAVESNSDV